MLLCGGQCVAGTLLHADGLPWSMVCYGYTTMQQARQKLVTAAVPFPRLLTAADVVAQTH
jgi:hypothetical protein